MAYMNWQELEQHFSGVDARNPIRILETALEYYGDRLSMAVSFQVGSVALIDMLYRIGQKIRVVSIDTGRLPEETYECANRVSERYDIAIEWVFPRHEAVETLLREHGVYSFKKSVANRRECCAIRRVEPLSRALTSCNAWTTGRRSEQGERRESLSIVEADPLRPGKIKINPLLHWSSAELWAYVRRHDVPYNRLYDQGYRSIGCECCTRPCHSDEGERSGRWWWEHEEIKECGLHEER